MVGFLLVVVDVAVAVAVAVAAKPAEPEVLAATALDKLEPRSLLSLEPWSKRGPFDGRDVLLAGAFEATNSAAAAESYLGPLRRPRSSPLGRLELRSLPSLELWREPDPERRPFALDPPVLDLGL